MSKEYDEYPEEEFNFEYEPRKTNEGETSFESYENHLNDLLSIAEKKDNRIRRLEQEAKSLISYKGHFSKCQSEREIFKNLTITQAGSKKELEEENNHLSNVNEELENQNIRLKLELAEAKEGNYKLQIEHLNYKVESLSAK